MIEPAFYKTIEQPIEAEFKDRGSKFIAYAFPVEIVENFKKRMLSLKKEHPKAAHLCFAYRIGTGGNNFRVNDDGEPPGSAGRPILGQIDGKELTNVAVIVTRYFGGTLLGIPGLINAYKTVASLALQITPIVYKQVEEDYVIQFNYNLMNEVMLVLKQYNCKVHTHEMQLFCNIVAGIPKSRLTEVLYQLKQIPAAEVKKVEK